MLAMARYLRPLGAMASVVGLLGVAARAEASEQQRLVDRARLTVESFSEAREMTEFRRLLPQAKAVVIVPSLVKIGYVVAGAGGTGVLLVRDSQTARWSPPAFYTLAAGSIGLQIGASASEVMLLVLTDSGLQALLKNRFKLGVDASAAVGPVGVGAQGATTSSNLQADIVSFTRGKGLFAGVSLEGAVLQPRKEWNQVYYGRSVAPPEIVLQRTVDNVGAAQLGEALLRASRAEPSRSPSASKAGEPRPR
jgi:lipid-binding SYLF domain-containing protein